MSVTALGYIADRRLPKIADRLDAATFSGKWKCAMVAALDLQLQIQQGDGDSALAECHRGTLQNCQPLDPELQGVVDRWREALGKVDWDYVMGRQ